MDNEWLVLVTVAECDPDGFITYDCGTLFEKWFADEDDATRCYQSINLSASQEHELWLYLSKWIPDNWGLYLMYEILYEGEIADAVEMFHLGHKED